MFAEHGAEGLSEGGADPAVIGEQARCVLATISRASGALTDAIARALKDVLLTAEEVPQGCDYVVDGTLRDRKSVV